VREQILLKQQSYPICVLKVSTETALIARYSLALTVRRFWWKKQNI
jgi:hypothetical protein